jgi:hypothetical protein
MILLAWRLIPAKMHSRWNRETWNHRFISPAALCLGARVSSLLTPEAANRCQWSLAALSPDLFHQPHFVWEQQSLRF